jgi:Domain of unknown function (DUF4157)
MGALAIAARSRDVLKPHRPDVRERSATPLRPVRAVGAHELQAVWAGRVSVQPKLVVTRPDDPLEHEADRVAQRVLAMQDDVPCSGGAPCVTPALGRSAVIARQEAEVDDTLVEEDEVADDLDDVGDVEEIDDSEADVSGMPKREPGSASDQPPRVLLPRGPGRPLPDDARAFFEPRFGRDLAAVHLHTDDEAANSARRLNARAYTVGTGIYFAAQRFDPGSEEGRALLAHELVHVLQQDGAGRAIHPQSEPGQRRRRGNRRSSRRPRPAAAGCPQGKQDKVVHNDCSTSAAADSANFISHLEVSIAGRTVTPTWQGTSGGGPWECSPNPSHTPRTPSGQMDQVGTKCTVNHTNMKKDGMAWFTGIARHGMRIGFHDSQPVGSGFVSHGCVRVRCSAAEIINRNTSSGVTTVQIS